MLRRNAVTNFTSLFHAAGVDQYATAMERLGNDLAARHLGKKFFHCRLHLVDEASIGAEQHALREFVVFGLAEQIHRHPVMGCCAIGQHQNFTRARNHVDAHRTEHAALGSSYISVARAGDFVNGWNGLRAIGQGGYGLRTTNGECATEACNISCSQYQCVFFAMWRWHHHDDVLHTRYMRRNGIHQYA